MGPFYKGPYPVKEYSSFELFILRGEYFFSKLI